MDDSPLPFDLTLSQTVMPWPVEPEIDYTDNLARARRAIAEARALRLRVMPAEA